MSGGDDSAQRGGDTTERPNILVVLADQLRRQSLAAYGDENVSTPHIDRLASAGVRFQNACSTYPVCVPFRFSLMTGQYAHTRFVPAIEWRMSPAERTLAHEFCDAGYETMYIGKWHLYGGHGLLPGHTTVKANRSPVPAGHRGGWQRWFGFELSNSHFDTVYFTDDDPTPHLIAGYQTDGLFDLAMQALAEDRHQPFCCVLSVEAPHPPFVAPDPYMQRWAGREVHTRGNYRPGDYPLRGVGSRDLIDDLRAYYAMIENLDDNIGRLRDFLERQGLASNTVVVLVADHGELLGSHGLVSKLHPYEESIGIPLVVYDPRQSVTTPKVVADPVCTEDLFPTLLGLADIQGSEQRPGVNLAPVIRGRQPALDRSEVLLEFVSELRSGMPYHDGGWRGLRGRRFKYTVLGGPEGGRPWQLFDLDADPLEERNLVEEPGHVDVMREQHALLRERIAESGDHYVLQPALGLPGINEWHEPPGVPVWAG